MEHAYAMRGKCGQDLDGYVSPSIFFYETDNSICNKDFDSGPCFSSMPKYYYRTETKKCEMFVYGGCGGNENRFDTQKACQEKCGGG
ncbi:hypothetical protein MRX96_022294 [Rhipicephalus microplus]